MDRTDCLESLESDSALLLASVGPDDRFGHVNAAWAGVPLNPAPRSGRDAPTSFAPAADRIRAALVDARAGQVRELEIACDPAAAEPTLIQLTLTGVAGHPGWVLVQGREITRLAGRRLAAGRMEAVGQLAGGAAHDLNNVFLIIGGNLELLADEIPVGTEQHELLENARRGVARAVEVTRHLLEFAREPIGPPAPLALDTLLLELVPWLDEVIGRRHEVRLVDEPPALNARVSRQDLRAVIVALVLNAGDAMSGSGEVTLRLTRSPATADVPATATITISDTGEGIDPGRLTCVTDPWVSSRDPDTGTGLGLAMVRRLIERNAGSFAIDSAPGQGTTVRLTLPLA